MLRTALALAGSAAFLASQQFVAEIDPAPATSIAADARNPLAVGDHVWFVAHTPDAGHELYRSDGTVAGTRRVLDFAPGAEGSYARPLVEVGGRLVFTGWDSLANVSAVWVTDGTGAGTLRLCTGISDTVPTRVVGVVNGRAVFIDDYRLWTTDLTPAGTSIIGGPHDVITPGQQRGTELLFLATTSTGVPGLWSTNGVTIAFRDFGGAVGASHFARLGNLDYFLVNRSGQYELWSTDGSQAGTVLVTPFGPPNALSGGDIVAAGGQLVFAAGDWVFRSDGTAAGTVQLALPSMTAPRQLTAAGNLAFFTAYTPANGRELWRTDGTVAGTFLVCDANQQQGGTGSSTYEWMTAVQGRLFCYVVGGGLYLLSSDGTVAGTQLLPAYYDHDNGGLGALGQEAVGTFGLGAPTGQGRMELFATDGTLAGTRQLTANRQVPGLIETMTSAALGETLYFVGSDAAHGSELWRSDGTAAGTRLVVDQFPGPGDGVNEVVAFEGAVWFGTRTGELWRSDGTAAGTVLVFQAWAGAMALGQFKVRNGALLFVISSPTGGQLRRSDGTTAGTRVVTGAQVIDDYEVIGNKVFSLAMNNYQTHLFCTDGTAVGTVDLGQARLLLGVLGNRLVYTADGAAERVLITDGTPQGTVQLHNGPRLYRSAGPFANQLIWNNDQGQVLVTDGVSVTTLPVPYVSQAPVIVGDRAYVVTADPTAGRALYVTDGTSAGTAPVAAPGAPRLGGVLEVQALGNRAFLAADDCIRGVEPWISDGTTAGTRLLADLHAGGNSNPKLIGVAGTKALFTADDGVRGRELWRLDLAEVSAASVQEFGVGCTGSQGTPRLRADGLPVTGTAGFGLLADRGRALSAAVWVAGIGTGSAPLGGPCSLLPTSPIVMTISVLDATGAGRLPLPVPGNAAWIGFAFTAQAVVVDAQGASPLGLSVSQGLFVVVGG